MTAPLTDPEQLKELLGIPFTPEQTACITAPPAPQVIVAGAGSGKTTVMAARVVWLVGTGQVAPERVLGLTFTNKAAGELTERVRKALGEAGVTGLPGAGEDDAPGEPRISTYHAFAGRLLTDHGLRLGLEPQTRLLADATRFQLAADVLRTAAGPFTALTKTVTSLVEDLLALDGELAEHLVGPGRLREFDEQLLAELEGAPLTNEALRKVPQTARARGELLGLVEEYRARKRARDLLDFGDQIALAAGLARDVPEVGRLLREEFSVVLLDEYQDTSVAQRVMLSGLFGGGTGHAVTAVGDPCQAIYGWRGASVANLDDFPRHFPNGDGTPAIRQALGENRRSGGRLLQLANGLARPLRALHEGVEALRPAPGAEQDGLVRCALLPTHAEELEWLADSVAHLVRTGTSPGRIAVLCRGAGDFAELQRVLTLREVPVEVVGLSGLLHLPEIADLVATCEVLHDPAANASLVRLLTGPRWRIGPRDLALLGRRARLLVAREQAEDPDAGERLAAAAEGVDPAETVSLADALETFLEPGTRDDGLPFSDEARVRFARLAAEIRDLRRSLADPLMDVLHRVLAVTGLEVELAASPQAVAARRRETLGAFLDVAAGFASVDGEVTLPAFLGFLRTAAQYEKGLDSSLPGGEDTVKVLTAHKAKGLEWDVVAVPGLVAKQFPSEQARESWTAQAKVLPQPLRGDAGTLPSVPEWNARGLKAYATALREHQSTEELRLGYVAFTRPRSLLLGSGHWWGPSQKKPRGPSAFLHALRAHCEEAPGHGEVEVWAPGPEEGEENPSSAASAEEHTWPLPLDAEALARRRAAAATVLRRLREAPGAGPYGEEPEPAGPGRTGGPTPLPAGAPFPGGPPCSWGGSGLVEEPPFPGGSLPSSGEPPFPGGLLPSSGGPGLAGESPFPGGQPPSAGEQPPVEETRACADEPSPEDAPPLDDEEFPPPPDDEEFPPPEDDPFGYGPPVDGEFAGGTSLFADEASPEPPRLPAAVPPQRAAGPAALTPEEARLAASWDRDLEALAGELRRSRRSVREVPLPASMSASQLMRMAQDPDAFARDLARPMPRPPQHAAARLGTRFHAWVEARFEELTLPLPDPSEPAEGAHRAADEHDLELLKEAFARSPYAERVPHRVEAPFQLTLAGRVIRGRIDAVYREEDAAGDVRYEIVDWKTGRAPDADPLQLAVYRLAWAEAHGLPVSSVTASFLHVRSGEVVTPAGLPGRERLERLMPGEDGTPSEGPDPAAGAEGDHPDAG